VGHVAALERAEPKLRFDIEEGQPVRVQAGQRMPALRDRLPGCLPIAGAPLTAGLAAGDGEIARAGRNVVLDVQGQGVLRRGVFLRGVAQVGVSG
jgi:hypothetical protein